MNFRNFKPGNQKIRNATKVVGDDGTKFDSKLEKFLYDLLTLHGIPFEFQKKYELQPKFRYRGELIRPIGLIVDFWLPSLNVIIDTKGFQTEKNILKWKMLKASLHADRLILERASNPSEVLPELPEIFLPSNRKKCEALVFQLKERLKCIPFIPQ